LIGCWGEDLVWATVLAGVKTACIVVDCWGGAVCMGSWALVVVVEQFAQASRVCAAKSISEVEWDLAFEVE
jgi:hypothetical protein